MVLSFASCLVSCCCLPILLCLMLPQLVTLTCCLIIASLRCLIIALCCLVVASVLPCDALALPYTLPCHYLIITLPCCLMNRRAAITCCLATITHYLIAKLLCQVTFCPPPHLLFRCLVASCLVVSLPCCLIVLCWLVFPSSLLFCKEELEA